MDEAYRRLLDALRCSLNGDRLQWSGPLLKQDIRELIKLASEHSVLPLLAEAVFRCSPSFAEERQLKSLMREARRQTVSQARRTADFILLYRYLNERGLEPILLKGLVCRSIYPQPDQRASVDEDLLVDQSEMALYHRAMLDYGLVPFQVSDPIEAAAETSYKSADGGLYVEIHANPLPPESEAYSDCNAPFEGAAGRSIFMTILDTRVRTLDPTDHLLYLVLHAYKHFLHGGFGIRQVCDIGMFAKSFADSIDWNRTVRECDKLHLLKFTAAVMRICEKHLGFDAVLAFSDIELDEEPLLTDILSGGLYGVNDINRAHSSTMTLNAVAANKAGRRNSGALHSVFLPAKELSGRYPYLRKHSILLPVAWVQRGWNYLFKKNGAKTSASESLRIGRNRVELLRQYDIID